MGLKHALLVLAFCAGLAGCVSSRSSDQSITWAGLGQSVVVDGPAVRAVRIISDSRCPKGVECVWAGELTISAEITTGAGTEVREIRLGKPEPVADGMLELVEVRPAPQRGQTIAPQDYRFGFRFAGGI